MIVIIDYGSGNLLNLKNALDYLGFDCIISQDPLDIKNASRLILPGVGSFGYMMDSLREKNIEKDIKEFIYSKKPFFGICLGLQALFEESEESNNVKGLSIFKGKVVRFKFGKVPQVGWNNIKINELNKNNKIYNLFDEGEAYFVNSYYILPEKKEIISTTTYYGLDFASSISFENITATQFHPEKSGAYGLDILRKWLSC
jgi:imidazole glycerol phosphate synthase glutamine amidotransferase subunit